MMRRLPCLAMFAMCLPGSVLAQSVSTPSSTNRAAGTALHSAGAAVGVAPAAHEVPAAAVVPTVPAAQPFAAGVTRGGTAVAQGTTQTGTNVQNGGVTVHPTGAVSQRQVDQETTAARGATTQAGSAVPSSADTACAEQDLLAGKCN